MFQKFQIYRKIKSIVQRVPIYIPQSVYPMTNRLGWYIHYNYKPILIHYQKLKSTFYPYILSFCLTSFFYSRILARVLYYIQFSYLFSSSWPQKFLILFLLVMLLSVLRSSVGCPHNWDLFDVFSYDKTGSTGYCKEDSGCFTYL